LPGRLIRYLHANRDVFVQISIKFIITSTYIGQGSTKKKFVIRNNKIRIALMFHTLEDEQKLQKIDFINSRKKMSLNST